MALLLVAVVLAGCTSSGDDEDGDTMSRGDEKRGWTVVVNYMTNRTTYHVTSDPSLFDTDGDGVSDFDEFFRGLDPRKADTDEDGLTDCQEIFHSNRTQCEDPDFDHEDGGTGTDPLRADSDAGRGRYASENLEFVDGATGTPASPGSGDGISDGDELGGVRVTLTGGRERTVVLDPHSVDTDSDGLDDGAEVFLTQSDPTVADTDGDGCDDGRDVYPSRLESYTAGITSFLLKREQADGGGDFLIRAHLVDQDQFIPGPGPGETTFYATGEEATFDDSDTEPVRAIHCNYNVWDPWARIEALAFHRDGDVAVSLDIASETTPGNVSTVWWDLRDGILAWERAGEPILDPLVFEGVDARIELEPRVVFS